MAATFHDLIGQEFKAWDGHTYVCDSYDPSRGLWMTRKDAPEANKADTEGQWRRNVSERAVGRTFHPIWPESRADRLDPYADAVLFATGHLPEDF